MATKHIGFKAAAKKIASKEGVGKKAASAILAASSRKYKNSSSNKALRKVKG